MTLTPPKISIGGLKRHRGDIVIHWPEGRGDRERTGLLQVNEEQPYLSSRSSGRNFRKISLGDYVYIPMYAQDGSFIRRRPYVYC